MQDRSAERHAMVDVQLAGRGIGDERVLAAFREVPRELFVAAEQSTCAYEDRPLPIRRGQSISQPFIVALMCEALGLSGGERVLEVGTGSGYAAAILARLACEVFTIERHQELAQTAESRLRDLGIDNVRVIRGDGTLGLAHKAPFDAIVVAAGGRKVPPPLVEQLAIGGRLVIPVGRDRDHQVLLRITRVSSQHTEQENLGDVRFVPLIGSQG